MDPGLAAFVILAVITGVIGYLAVQQGKIKRQIEESRRQEDLANLSIPGALDPGSSNPPEAPQHPPSEAEGHQGGDHSTPH